jgi:hypothetical protein
MKDKTDIILNELEAKLRILNLEEGLSIESVEKSIVLCEEYLNKLREFLEKNKFDSVQGEINFFKIIKPKFTSKLHYYISLFNLELKRPINGKETLRKYLQEQLEAIGRFKDANIETYKYYRSGATFLDEKLFVRNKRDLRLFLDPIVYQFDINFSTTHDHKIAIILAYDDLELHVRNELKKIETDLAGDKPAAKSKFDWTEKKVSLVELIYALLASKSINYGKVDIAELADFCELHFNIDLGDYYRKYLEIKSRKYHPTKFLDAMKESLAKKMEEELE